MNKYKYIFFGYLLGVLLALLFGCKDKEQPVITVPETINASVKQMEDSLRKEVAELKDSIAIYKQLAAKAAVRKEVIKERIVERPVPTTDSGALNAYNDLKNDFDQYVVSSDQQAEAQVTIISNQDRVITAQLADIELQKSKYKLLRDAYDSQAVYVQQIRSDFQKDRKLHGQSS